MATVGADQKRLNIDPKTFTTIDSKSRLHFWESFLEETGKINT